RPASAELNKKLAKLGSTLVALHLLEASQLKDQPTSYFGPNSPEIERIAWSADTIWLDATANKKEPISGSRGFRGVPRFVWDFNIGGYPVCERWLKERRGRKLSKGDLTDFQKILVALSETHRLMKEVDLVIETHGGWQAAFQSSLTPANIS